MDIVKEEQSEDARNTRNFMLQFIDAYKEQSVLWDQNHPKYKSKRDRSDALEVLLNDVVLKYYPNSNLDFVKAKIDSIRTVFRKERKKVMKAKLMTKNDDNTYKPNLWYYKRLLFLVGEEVSDDQIPDDIPEEGKSNLWSKPDTICLIELLKSHPVLYTVEGTTLSNRARRFRAYQQLTSELSAQTQKKFEVSEVKRKISTLKQQLRREKRRKRIMGETYSPCWCYDLMSFMKDKSVTKEAPNLNNDDEDSEDAVKDDNTEGVNEVEKLFINFEGEFSETDRKPDENRFREDDIFDTIGKNVAVKLRDMNDEQQIYAEQLLNDIMYNGLMENLNAQSRISITGD